MSGGATYEAQTFSELVALEKIWELLSACPISKAVPSFSNSLTRASVREWWRNIFWTFSLLKKVFTLMNDFFSSFRSLQAREDMHTNCINLVVTALSEWISSPTFINAWNNLPMSVLLIYPLLVGLLGALILEFFWNVVLLIYRADVSARFWALLSGSHCVTCCLICTCRSEQINEWMSGVCAILNSWDNFW